MEKIFTTALLYFLPFGPRSNARLFSHFGGAEAIWKASYDELRAAGVEENRIATFVAWRRKHQPEQLFERIKNLALDVVPRHDDRYPETLKTIFDPPLGFFLKGNLPPAFTPLISIVGTREPSNYGLKIGAQLAHDLTARGLGIVSGGARGIDECVHRAAASSGGYTLAVLAQGHTNLAARHRSLVQTILNNGGGIISEYPPNAEGLPFRYPIRNRIIAGLSPGTVVIEAKAASGTLITAQAAVEAGREVFAVPGPIDSSTSEGANRLLKDGAHVVTNADDIIEALGLHLSRVTNNSVPKLTLTSIPTGNTPAEQIIIDLLSRGQLHIDDLARATKRPASELLATLTYLEIEGKVRSLGNMEYGL